jgi:hypothetical protein
MPVRRVSKKSLKKSSKSKISLRKSLKARLSRKSRTSRKASKSRKSRSTPRKQKGGKLNAYFKTMLNAKKNNLKSFQYNGKTYKQATLKTGMVIYKR